MECEERKIEHAEQVKCRICLAPRSRKRIRTLHPRSLYGRRAKWIASIHAEAVPVRNRKTHVLSQRFAEHHLFRVVPPINKIFSALRSCKADSRKLRKDSLAHAAFSHFNFLHGAILVFHLFFCASKI